MRRILALALVAGLAAPAAAKQAPQLDDAQQTLLRCSAAFAIVASEQARGAPGVAAYPLLGERGREYFVRASAQLMDELGLTRGEVSALLQAEVGRLQDHSGKAANPAAYVDGVMQPCLVSLAASGI